MKKLIIASVLALLPMLSQAAGGGVHLEPANVDISDQASLQRGAKTFINYCLSCHSASFQRYNRMGQDLGLTDAQVKENLMFASEKVGDTMTIAMSAADGAKWFGTAPPDLSVIARARGADWLYTYFTTFYADDARPFGVNNAVFADVGMPHVLVALEGGLKTAIRDEHHVITGYEPPISAEYEELARDLTNFLVYVGEPSQLKRRQMGVWVLLFLGVFFVLTYLMKKEYWKDIH
ncbi:MAG: cytochrome c1 [Gammaproteobacteria bacterium]|nr:cytochrome c1 [Gammaproteobacteria bacterium]